MAKNKYFNLLPEVYQTPVNKTFFDATYEQLFGSKEVEKVDGFIGRRVSGLWDPAEDYYLYTNSKNRTWYQLEPIAHSIRPNTVSDSNEMFYEDLLNKIAFHGGITNNHDRMFSGGYYTFAPPIDFDKFINYQSYKWVENLPVLQLKGIDDDDIDEITSSANYTHSAGQILSAVVKITGEDYQVNDIVTLIGGSGEGATLEITAINAGGGVTAFNIIEAGENYMYGDENVNVSGGSGSGLLLDIITVAPTFTYDGDSYANQVEFTSGMRVKFVDTEYFNKVYTVEGVGRKITLVEDLIFSVEDVSKPEYVTIERGATDNNPWSRRNKWYNSKLVDTIQTLLDMDVQVKNSRRPIIEFIKDIELYNFGKTFKGVVDYVIGDRFDVVNGHNINLVQLSDSYVANFYSKYGYPTTYDNKNAVLELIGDDFPEGIDIGDKIQISGSTYNNGTYRLGEKISDNAFYIINDAIRVKAESTSNITINYFEGDYEINGVALEEGDTIVFTSNGSVMQDLFTYDNVETYVASTTPYNMKLTIPIMDSESIVADVTRTYEISCTAPSTINVDVSGEKLPLYLSSGSIINISGMVNSANNGTFVVASRVSDYQLTVTATTLVNEGPVPTAKITFKDVDWYSVEDQENILSFKSNSKNSNWVNPSDDIDGLIEGDLVTVTVGDGELAINPSDYIWEVNYVFNKNGDLQIVLYPVGTRSNALQEKDVIITIENDVVVYYVYNDGVWTKEVQKKNRTFQPPLYNLYYTDLDSQGNAVPLSDLPGSNFDGSEIFSYKVNTDSRLLDRYIGIPLEYKNLGQIADIVFEHDLMTNRFFHVPSETMEEIKGYYYFKQYVNGAGEYNTTWLPAKTESKQRVTDFIVIKALKEQKTQIENYYGDNIFNLDFIGVLAQSSITVAVYDGVYTYDYTDYTVTENNKRYTITMNAPLNINDEVTIKYTINDVFQISVQPEKIESEWDTNIVLQGDVLNQADDFEVFAHNGELRYVYIKKDFNYNDVLHVSTYSKDPLPSDSRGFYEIPAQLEANPLNGEVYEYSANDFTKHFLSIIVNQDRFSGQELSFNNYGDSKKDITLGTEILQCRDNVLKTMLFTSEKNISVFDSIRLSKAEYVRFKDKIASTINQIEKEKTYVDVENVILIDSLIKEALNRINNSIYYNGAFKYTHMFSHSYFFFEKEYIDGEDEIPDSKIIEIDIIEDIDLNDPSNSLYVYRGHRYDGGTGDFTVSNEVCDVVGVDYDIISTSPIRIQLYNHVNENILVRIYKDSAPAYVPTTPSKNGMYKCWVPELKLDKTYVSPTYIIVGHDGSKTPILKSNETVFTDYQTLNMTNNNGTLFTLLNHGLKTGDKIIFNGETYNDSFTMGIYYYVIRDNKDSFRVSDSLQGATSGLVRDRKTFPAIPNSFDLFTKIAIYKMTTADIALLEVERRIYNDIHNSFKHDYVPALSIPQIFSSQYRVNRYSSDELLDLTKPYFYRWKADNNSNYKDHFNYDSTDWKTWNYKSANPTLPGHWKGIYKKYYDTTTPNTTPWEMVGFSEKPTWWDIYYSPWEIVAHSLNDAGLDHVVGNRVVFAHEYAMEPFVIQVTSVNINGSITAYNVLSYGEYASGDQPDFSTITMVNIDNTEASEITMDVSWERKYNVGDYTSNNDRLWSDIESGVIRSGEREGIDQNYIRVGLSSILPVDINGNLRSPHDIGIAIEPTINKDLDWVFGDNGPVEETWRNSSEYVFDLMEIFLLTRPSVFGEQFFDCLGTVRAEINKQQIINFNDRRRVSNSNLVVHGEENEDGTIIKKYGYQHFISDYVTFNGNSIKSTLGDKVRELNVKLGNKFSGFTDLDTLDLFMQSVGTSSNNVSLIIPKENVNVKLFKTPTIKEYVYSGVAIRATEGGFAIVGYDTISNSFKYYPRRKNSLKEKIHIGGKSVEFSYFKIGKPYVTGVYVKYNSAFHECVVAHTPTKFVPEYWRRVEELPYVGGVVVDRYKENTGTLQELEYGTILSSIQEVFDFLIGYGEFLEEEGWVYDEYFQEVGEVKNWLHSAKDFCYWSLMNWGNDNVLFLSPCSNKVTLDMPYGYPDEIGDKNTNNVYSITDQYGYPISISDVYVERDGKRISVKPLLQGVGINCLRITSTQHEHIVTVDNKTIFNDTIYDPILKDRQHRLRVSGYRTIGWYGKMEAAGYMINGDTILQNPDNLVESIRRLYDTEVPLDNPEMENAARHLIGFETREYLDQIQVSGDTQFKFYQGMISEKGTIQPMTKILRSQYIDGNENIEIYEEWAFKLAEFGSIENNTMLEFIIDGYDIKTEPQMVKLIDSYSDTSTGYVKKVEVINSEYAYTSQPMLEISPPDNQNGTRAVGEIVLDENGYIKEIQLTRNGSLYSEPPKATIKVFKVLDDNTKGYVSVDNGEEFHFVMGYEITPDNKNDDVITIDIDDTDKWISRPKSTRFNYIVPTMQDVTTLIPNAGYVHLDDVRHQAFRFSNLRDVYDKIEKPVIGHYIWVADCEEINLTWGVFRVIGCNFNDVLVKNQIPNYFAIEGVLYRYTTAVNESGVEVIEQILNSDDVDVYDELEENGSLDKIINVYVLHRVTEKNNAVTTANGLTYWVDNNVVIKNGVEVNEGWAVYRNGNVIRKKGILVDSERFVNGILYDYDSKKTITDFQIYDPYKGILLGPAEKNITFKSSLDPARYTSAQESYLINDSMAFTEQYIGLLWWDLSDCKYIHYEQGTPIYRRDNWGKLFLGSQISIYEWVRSPAPPASYSGTGTVKNFTDYVYRKEFSPEYGEYVDVYYFWVKDKTTTPSGLVHRTMSAASVANMIFNPLSHGAEWFAFVDQNNYVFSNLEKYFKDSHCVMQINLHSVDDNVDKHVEWKLIRENDADNAIPTKLWDKMVDSIVERDKLGNFVPNLNLSVNERYGNEIRPRQTWFKNVYEARRCLTKSINDILISFNMKDSRIDWDEYVTTNYCWSYVDWFADGYDKNNISPKKQVLSLNVNEDLYDVNDGDIIKEYRKNNSSWYLIVSKETKQIELVCREKSAVQLNQTTYANVRMNKVRTELRQILNTLKNKVFYGNNKYGTNKLFFSMVNYAMSEQQNLDWLFKTTYISITHQGQTLRQPVFYRPSTIGSYLQYVNEVKPYQTKIREYNLKYASPIDSTLMRAWDFDSLSYNTSLFSDQKTYGVPSSIPVTSPVFNPSSVPRVININSKYDSIQCGFQQKPIYVDFGTETKFTNGTDNYIIFDDAFCATAVYADGHELPTEYYSLDRNTPTKNLKITFTQGTPVAGVEIKVTSGITFIHTQLEEARLFSSVGYKDDLYKISSKDDNLAGVRFKQSNPIFGGKPTITIINAPNDGIAGSYWKDLLNENARVTVSGTKYNDGKYIMDKIEDYYTISLVSGSSITNELAGANIEDDVRISVSGYGTNVAFDLKVSAYGQVDNGFGNFKFGHIPFGYGGTVEESDVTKHGKFNIAVGASSRYLHLIKKYRDIFKSVPYDDGIRYSEYCEKLYVPSEKEQNVLPIFQEDYAKVYKCHFEGIVIDGEDYNFKFTVPWDSEAWDTEGEYPEAGWDREYTTAGVINPVAKQGREYLYVYEDTGNYDLSGIITEEMVQAVSYVIIDDGVETEEPYGGSFTFTYDWDMEIYGEYVTTINLVDQLSENDLDINPPKRIVKVKIITRPYFMFLSSGDDYFYIPYVINDVNTVTVVDSGSPTPISVNSALNSINYPINSNVTEVTLTTPPTASQISPLIKSFVLVSYDHDNSNVFDNGEMFETIDGSFLAAETFDEHMPDELAKFKIGESVVINVNTNCTEYQTTIEGDGTTTYALGLTNRYGIGSVEVYVNDVLQSFPTDYDLQISVGREYTLEFAIAPTIGSSIRVEYKRNVLPIYYSADDAMHWDSMSSSSIYFDQDSVRLDVNNSGWDTKPFDATSSYDSRYLVPSTDAITSPDSLKVYVLNDSVDGIEGVDSAFLTTDYEVLSVDDYINNYYMVDYPSATYQEALEALVLEYKKYMNVSYIDDQDYASMLSNFSVVKFNTQHVRPLEEYDSIATGTATINAGAVDAINITSNGFGYSYVPDITFTGGGGSGATALAILDPDGSVSSVIITNGGSGYVSPPTVAFVDRSIEHNHAGVSAQKVLIEYSMPSISHTVHYENMGAVTYTRNSYDYSTTLYSEFKIGDLEINVVDATALGIPSIMYPATIWIANERLTFTNVVDNGSYYTLQGISRATKGTSMPGGLKFIDGTYPVGQMVFNGDVSQQIPDGQHWLWTNSNGGLAVSTTLQALYLRSHTGCKDIL